MNLRLRLIVAFFVLSVVPLGAVTFYTYASNAAALREAAGHEAESLAGDLTQRMQLVTTQISERVEHLMDAHRETDGGTATAPEPTPGVQTLKPKAHPKLPTAPPEPVATTAAAPAQDSVAQALGEVAMILNNIEVRGWRPPPGGRGTPPPGVPTDGRGGPGGPGSQAGPGSNDRGFRGEGDRRSNAPGGPQSQPLPPVPPFAPTPAPAAAPAPAPPAPPSLAAQPKASAVPPAVPPPATTDAAGTSAPPDPSVTPPPDRRYGRRIDRNADQDPAQRARGFGGRPDGPGAAPEAAGRGGAPPVAPIPPENAVSEKDRMLFDMMPIRREMIQQLVGSSEDWQKLSPEERQKVIGEVNQRMLGIVQGIQLGAAELQKKVSEAQRLADEKARAAEMAAAAQRAAAVRNRAAAEAAKVAREATHANTTAANSETATSGTSGPMRRKIALSGTRLDVTVERNGTVVREANAEVNLPNLLATVFTTTRRERKEVPFAFAQGRPPLHADRGRSEKNRIAGRRR